MAKKIIRRKDALAQGLTHYYTGRPCRTAQHIAERYTVNGDCVACKPAKHKRLQWWRKNRERHNEQTRNWERNNPEKKQAMWRRYYDGNREQILERNAIWQKANSEKVLATTRRYQTRILMAEGLQPTKEEAAALLRSQKYRCVYCRTDLRKTKKALDHWMPLTRGGANWIENRQWICASCNARKADKDPILFAQEIGCVL